MEICKIEISMDDLKKLHFQGIKYTLNYVDETGFDYSTDPVWRELKSASTKAFKKLKNREFDLRHNNKR